MPDLVAEVRSGEYEAECRQQCAYNLPCMVAFAGGSVTYRTSLHGTFSSLVTDPSLQVRTTVAAAFHQVRSSSIGTLFIYVHNNVISGSLFRIFFLSFPIKSK